MSKKKFVKIFLIIMFFFVVYNLLIWNFYTEKILTDKKGEATGDLTRMSYLSNYSMVKKNITNLEKRHLESYEFNYDKKIDVITMGDSFSNGMARGENPFYQDYMSSKSNLKILNLNQLPDSKNFVESIYILLNSGFLKRSGTKYIILESVQRKIVDRFTMNISPDKNKDLEEINSFYKFGSKDKSQFKFLPDVTFINNGNFKFIFYNLFYNFSDNAFFSKVYKVPLSENFFSHKNGTELLFFFRDIDSIKHNSIDNLKLVNEQFNSLSKKLKTEGINLIFMPAVNKYDLYYDYILNNKYEKDQFFDIYRSLQKDYIFIDTKKIFLDCLKDNTQDIYYIDDMHWSNIASDIITNEILKYID